METYLSVGCNFVLQNSVMNNNRCLVQYTVAQTVAYSQQFQHLRGLHNEKY